MLCIESSLSRLKDRVNRFVLPSVALRNVSVLEAQIEFRREALREIEVIRCELRSLICHESNSLQRRRRNGRGANQLCLDASFRRRRPVDA
jgi:hypothetical protein